MGACRSEPDPVLDPVLVSADRGQRLSHRKRGGLTSENRDGSSVFLVSNYVKMLPTSGINPGVVEIQVAIKSVLTNELSLTVRWIRSPANSSVLYPEKDVNCFLSIQVSAPKKDIAMSI